MRRSKRCLGNSLGLLILGLTLLSCGRSPGDLRGIPYAPQPYVLEEPAYFVKILIPDDNPFTAQGVALGRRLFHDPILSGDGTLSCAVCHRQELAFSDGKALSEGLGGRGRRGALPLFNVGYHYRGLFWDGRVASLEEQTLVSVEDPLELGAQWDTVLERLRRHEQYPRWFREAFGITHRDSIERMHVAKALAQFQRTLVSADAKYDRVLRGEAVYTPAEQRGWAIFFDASDTLPFSECGHCHLDPLFTNLEFFNNGLDAVANLEDFSDQGRRLVTGRRSDAGKFRTPSLRNIALSAPYMHDGRFATLEEVIDHYVSGGHYAENVNPNVRKLRFTDQDKADLIAFLHTLTDTAFLENKAFGNPW
jgi:cytochrome c peroxidase